jgi:hypothetical protein
VGRANNPPLSFIMAEEYIYKEAFIKALDELKRVGIIKNNYSAN